MSAFFSDHASRGFSASGSQFERSRRVIPGLLREPAGPISRQAQGEAPVKDHAAANDRRNAFSLLELVVAMGIMLALSLIALTGYTHLVDSTAIDAGVQSVDDLLTEARQDAVAQNTAVEVRLYEVVSPGRPAAYGTLQLRWMQSNGTTPPAAKALILPAAAVIDATAVHSSLVTTNTEKPTPDPTDPRIDALTRAFHFLPNGSTDLATNVKWLLTLRAASQSNPASFPANWACVELDPVTGRTQLYRP